MKKITVLLVALLILSGLTGGLYVTLFWPEEDDDEPILEPGPFDFNETIPTTTHYHFGDAVNATDSNNDSLLTGNNTPFWTEGTYYGEFRKT